jgi:DnaJ like chaperone protein
MAMDVKAVGAEAAEGLGSIAMKMRWTGKVIGGVIGLLAGGPVGAALGAVVGHQFDNAVDEGDKLGGPGGRSGSYTGPTLTAEQTASQFFVSTFRVMGHVAKADGRVTEQEIAAARSVMASLRLDSMQVAAAINEFTRGKQSDFKVMEELGRLAQACAGRPDLVRIFLELQVRAALAGNNIEGPVRKYLNRVASTLGVSVIELAQIEAVLRIQRGNFSREQRTTSNAPQQLSLAYKVLEVEATATNDEVVKAYRRALSRHHPDKLKANGLPESMIEHAKERTQQIIEAYELIKERRGLA